MILIFETDLITSKSTQLALHRQRGTGVCVDRVEPIVDIIGVTADHISLNVPGDADLPINLSITS